MVRMGALYDQSILMKDRRDNKTNMTAEEQAYLEENTALKDSLMWKK